jgi:glycosyltransferase involved in cell wall biosynthesis
MNVLFITSTLPRYPDDGQAPFVLEQALAWQKRFNEDRVCILAPHDKGTPGEEEVEGVLIKRFRYWWPVSHQALAYPAILPNLQKRPWLLIQLPALLLCEYLAARRLIKDHGIDFVFAHWVMPQGIVAYLLNKFSHVPYGLKNYSSDLRILGVIPGLGPLLARQVIESSTRLICENSMLRQDALSLFPEDRKASVDHKVVALTMGVFHGLESREAPPENDHTYDIGFIGRLSGKKGVGHLLAALAELDKRCVSCRAGIAGSGEEESKLRAMCELPDVTFLGHVSGDSKVSFFHSARILVFPSVPHHGDVEGLPVSLLEALYLGKTVIASRDTNIELLPEWPALKSRVYLLENPADSQAFAMLLAHALATPAEEQNRELASTQAVTARFGWSSRIAEYRKLLISTDDAARVPSESAADTIPNEFL